MDEEKKVETKVKKSFMDFNFWKKEPIEEKPIDPAKLVSIDQLPLYDDSHLKSYVFSGSPPLPLQENISKVRKSATDQCGSLMERFKDADRVLHKGVEVAYTLNKQIREEWTTVPKGMAILMGGMAGYILGIRRSFLRRWFYSFTGLATMAAFCYPEETAHFFRTGIAHSKMAWENFKESPEPSVDSNIDEPTDTENVPKPSETVDESVTVNEK